MTGIKYAGSSGILTTCPRCQRSVDSHPHAPVLPSPETTKAANAFAALLQKEAVFAKSREIAKRAEFMVGALQARVGGKTYRFVGHSGAASVHATTMDGGWEVVADFPTTVSGQNLRYAIDGGAFIPVADVRPTPCAAPKLMCALFERAGGHSIDSISMTELWWRNPADKPDQSNRAWSQLEPVHSCDNCKLILPQMLCDRPDVGMESFRPALPLANGVTMRQVRCTSHHTFMTPVADNAWRAYAASPGGVSTMCPQCRKTVQCIDPARAPMPSISCCHCAEVFSGEIPVGTRRNLECPICGRSGMYQRSKEPAPGSLVYGRK